MTKINPTYDMKNDADLSAFLLGAIRDLRKDEITVEKAMGISQLADKYTKHEIMRCLKFKLSKGQYNFNLEGEINKQLMTRISDSDD